PLFCKELAEFCGMEAVLPMNTGAEAVETAIKTARRWGYRTKKIPTDKAEIIVCENNFHGRTTTIVGFSSEEAYRDGFGPFTPGFVPIPFGDIAALEQAITPNTCAFLVEPIQAEAGILIPPAGYLKAAAELCRKNNVLLLLDEIQTGLGRTGRKFASDHDGVRPDVYILGKALSGGFYPVSAVVSSRELLAVFDPGSHGSTFGGNPLACAIARTALWVLGDEQLAQRSDELGTWFLGEIAKIEHPEIREVRGRGLLIGIELTVPARKYCEALKDLGMLCKETHDKVIRIAPPLVVERDDLAWAVERLREVFRA
ncbi:MAG: ornithine--oxo-acid transaminase, partial [Gemmatimonadaceae bacterium]